MGSYLEINDTLQITTEQGFPVEILNLERHLQTSITLDEVRDRVFSFHDKPGARIFHLDPVRVYIAHNIDGQWLFWGRAFIQSQTIAKKLNVNGVWTGEWVTSGTYRIVDLYEPDYQKTFTAREARVDN
jgi:hypothetical protein